MNEDKESVRGKVMEAISAGRVHMRPRWHFVLRSLLAVVGISIVALSLVYVVSLAVFLTRESGAWFAPSFGARGWMELIFALPWLLIVLSLVFVAILEVLARRYAFVYKKPLVVSILVIALSVSFGGFFIARSPFHHQLSRYAHHGQLPGPLMFFYGTFLHHHSDHMFRGAIVSTSTRGFVIVDPDGDGTSTVLISSRTRLPHGDDFEMGAMVVVVGDSDGSGTVQAFGIREIDD